MRLCDNFLRITADNDVIDRLGITQESTKKCMCIVENVIALISVPTNTLFGKRSSCMRQFKVFGRLKIVYRINRDK